MTHLSMRIQRKRFLRGVARRRRQSARRHFKNGQRTAVLRAITGARLYGTGRAGTLAKAATSCGSNIPYVAAAVVLLKSENMDLINQVLAGYISLLAAARMAKRVADLVDAYRRANAADHVTFGRIISPGALFENTVAPAL